MVSKFGCDADQLSDKSNMTLDKGLSHSESPFPSLEDKEPAFVYH